MNQPLLFDLPAAHFRRPSEPIVRDAMVKDGCRFWLKRAWGAGPLIAWVMCNPSNADATRDDPTMLRVMEFSASWGFGSCVVINIIPFISSSPDEALAWAKRADYWMIDGDPRTPEWRQWQDNIEACSAMIAAAKTHIVAWGNHADRYAGAWLQDIAENCNPDDCELPPIEWLCLGTNSNGSPRHPLSRGKNRVPPDFKAVRGSA
jgi:hypothetical protein